jgi:hypothetical protein
MNFLGEICTTPDQKQGNCRFLKQCPVLIKMYQNESSQNNVKFIVAAQKICGNRAIKNEPIVCCANEINFEQVEATNIGNRFQNCNTPDGVSGDCRCKYI